MKLIPFLILTSFLFPISKSFLSIGTNIKNKRIYISLFTGSPEQTITTIVNMDKSFSLFTSDTFDPKKSTTSKYIQSHTVQDKQNTFEVDVYQDNFKFSYVKASDSNYKYYYLSNPSQNETNLIDRHYGLSFSYKTLNDEFSFISHLYKNKYIKKKIFTFKQFTYPPNVYLYLGLFPDKIIENSKSKGMCKVLPKYSTWGCNLNYIVTNGFKWTINKYASFRINKSEYLFSCAMHNLILNNYIQNYMKDNRCRDVFKGKTNNKKYCSCDKEIVKELKKKIIGFSFGNFVKYVNISSMFKCNEDEKECLSLFKCIEEKDEYIFNKDFILSSVTVFDYEREIVEFYNGDNEIEFKVISEDLKGIGNDEKKDFTWSKGIFFVNSVLMSYMILALFVGKILRKGKRG